MMNLSYCVRLYNYMNAYRQIKNMKTFKGTKTEVLELPLLKIQYDDDSYNPRENDGNIGVWVEKSNGYQSPDGRDNDFYHVMIEARDIAKDTDDHIAIMKKELKKLGYDIRHIFPVSRFEHGGIKYQIGTYYGFDYSNSGFYFVTKEKLKEFFGRKRVSDDFMVESIKNEIDLYNKYVNGFVYCYSLLDKDEMCYEFQAGSFYDIDDIKNELGDEWKDEDMNDYLVY